MALLGVLYIPGLARLTYTSAMVECPRDYVAARRLQGVAGWRIMLGDVLPNCLSPVIVQATLLVAVGIIIEAAISFVGLGVQPPTPSWGTMLAEARNFLFSGEWWLSLFPGLAISLTVIGFNLLGDGLRDVLDPRRNTASLHDMNPPPAVVEVSGLRIAFGGASAVEVVRGVGPRASAGAKRSGWWASPAPARA